MRILIPCHGRVFRVLHLHPMRRVAGAVRPILGLETNPSNPKQAGVPEEVGTDLALLEVGQEDAIDAPRKQPGQVRLAHAQRQLANVVAVVPRTASYMRKINATPA
jgi:hypothetical protein